MTVIRSATIQDTIGSRIALAFFLALAFPLQAMPIEQEAAAGAKGPLVTRNLYSYYLPFINLAPEGARNLGAGSFRASVINSYANTFRYDPEKLIDGFFLDTDVENYQLAIDLDFGVFEFLDLGIGFSYLVQYGGILDAPIQAYHHFFGFRNQGRELVADNRFLLKVENEKGIWLNLDEPVYGSGDLTLKGKLGLLELPGSGFYLALQPALKIPVGNTASFLSNGSLDFSVDLLAEMTIWRLVFYLNCGWIHLAKPADLTIFEFYGDLFSYAFAVELILSEAWSLYVQIDGSTSPYRSGHEWLDSPSTTINFGFKTKISKNMLLQCSFAQEFFAFSTTDISVTAGLVLFW